jgi:hypothetical protein
VKLGRLMISGSVLLCLSHLVIPSLDAAPPRCQFVSSIYDLSHSDMQATSLESHPARDKIATRIYGQMYEVRDFSFSDDEPTRKQPNTV